MLLYHSFALLSIVFEKFFSKFSVNKNAHNDKALICAHGLAEIACAGGKSDYFIAAANVHAEVVKAHALCGGGDGGNIHIVAVDIERKVLCEGNRKNSECVRAAVGGKVNILVFGNNILISQRHKRFEFAAGLFERNEAVAPVVTVNYGVLRKLAAAEVCGAGCPCYAAVCVIGSLFALPNSTILNTGTHNRKVCGNGVITEGIRSGAAGIAEPVRSIKNVPP